GQPAAPGHGPGGPARARPRRAGHRPAPARRVLQAVRDRAAGDVHTDPAGGRLRPGQPGRALPARPGQPGAADVRRGPDRARAGRGGGGRAAPGRRRSAWLLAALWAGCALLALGTSLWIGRHQYLPLALSWNGVRVSGLMPYTWFVRIPGLASFREADRLAILGLLPAALLAGAAGHWPPPPAHPP